jgi:TonB-linked SusC/RagA family outer membrane protein
MKRFFQLMIFLFLSGLWFQGISQAIQVKGNITDATNGEPLIGVNILIKGTSTGTVTDFDGNYILEVNPDDALIFSYIGYQSQEIDVSSRNVIDVMLQIEATSLDEIVVIGYGTTKKRDLTGSVTSISSKTIESVPIISADQALQGRAAGVFVQQNSGEPGAATTIRIRGTSSISAGNEPLYVIDGIPILTSAEDLNSDAAKGPRLNPLSTISPSDIASIEVLKDASAAAIYGARAANGVILITTKRGKAGESKIDLSLYRGWQEVRNPYTMLNGSQFAHFLNEANFYAGNGRIYSDPKSFGEGTDWQDELFRIAPMSNYELSFSGGSEKLQYAISGAFHDQDGVLLGSDFDRYNLRANVDGQLSERIKISNSLMASHTESSKQLTEDNAAFDGGALTSALGFSPLVPVRDVNGNFIKKNYAVDDNGNLIDGTQTDSQGNTITESTLSTFANPILKSLKSPSKTKITRVIDNLAGTLSITEDLKLKISLGFDFATSRDDQFTPRASRSGGDSFASSGSVSTLSLLNENTLSYKKSFGKHSIDAVAGVTAQKTEISSLSITSIDITNDQFGFNNYGIARGTETRTNFAEFTFLSGLGRLNYVLNDKYLFTVTGRADGSSKFGDKNKWGFFPSVSLAWRMSEESFIRKMNFFDNLKLRVSYGVIGNESIGPYLSQALLVPVELAFDDQLTIGFEPFIFPNRDLKWESTEQFNIGFDASFDQGRFSFTADYYKKNTFDLLLTTDVPLFTGYQSVFGNVGDLKNEGVEFSIESRNFVDKFVWRTSFNIAFNKNTVTNLAGRDDIPNSQAQLFGIESWALLKEGEPVGRFYGLLTDGIFQIGDDPETTPRFSGEPLLQPGERKFKDLNNDGVINDEDRTFIGNAQADFNFGLNNDFSYKGFDLNIFIQGVAGNEIVNFNKFLVEQVNGTSNVSLEFFANRWTPQNPSNEYPKVNADPGLTRRFISDAEVENGSYLRLKSVSLGYNLPERMIRRAGLVNARIYLTASNLITWTEYSGYDPEVSHFGQSATNFGADLGGFPSTKSILVGLNLGF